MYLAFSKYFFVTVSVLFLILFSARAFLPDFFRDSKTFSPVMAGMGGLLLLYVFAGLVLCVFVPAVKYKLVMLAFTISPFLIGKFVTYKKLKLYSIIQILCVILSVAFVVLV